MLTLLLSLTLAAHAADTEPAPKRLTAAEVEKAAKSAREHLEKLMASAAAVAAIKDEATARALPGHAFFTALFRQYPVGMVPPAGLSSSNLVAVDAKGKVTVISKEADLEKFLIASLPPASSDNARKDAARAAVRLGQELHQDGFYRFELQDDSTKTAEAKGGHTATARVVVMQGGSGTFTVTITLDRAGKVTKLETDSKIRPGPRPRCQATKLLDRDPIVRDMAEQHLLIMGRAAKPYLDEQRAKASPELRKAIDRLWQRILADDR